MLIILGGLPGTGKTTIARELARQLGAVHVRIDSIEEAILDSGVLSSPINDAGYRVGNAVAADNLRIGRTVIADSVNPIPLSRDGGWPTFDFGESATTKFGCLTLRAFRRVSTTDDRIRGDSGVET
jgi:predicted kinase